MPTFTRLIFIILILAGFIYAAMWGLVLFVRPVTTDLTIDIPSGNIELRPWPDETIIRPQPADEAH